MKAISRPRNEEKKEHKKIREKQERSRRKQEARPRSSYSKEIAFPILSFLDLSKGYQCIKEPRNEAAW